MSENKEEFVLIERGYKPAKTVKEQTQYLHDNKRVQFNDISEEQAQDYLLQYNYINVITPFKHHFARVNENQEVIKDGDNKHIYDRNVEFAEYYERFKEERNKYAKIAENIMNFEIHFKSILSYTILTNTNILTSTDLLKFLNNLKLNFFNLDYSIKKLNHMRDQINNLISNIDKYHDIYCFFDRMSLGTAVTIFRCLDEKCQKQILNYMKSYNLNLGVITLQDFYDRAFTLVSIRNCVMHCNSLEVLKRFLDPKIKKTRQRSDRRRFENIIKLLSE